MPQKKYFFPIHSAPPRQRQSVFGRAANSDARPAFLCIRPGCRLGSGGGFPCLETVLGPEFGRLRGLAWRTICNFHNREHAVHKTAHRLLAIFIGSNEQACLVGMRLEM